MLSIIRIRVYDCVNVKTRRACARTTLGIWHSLFCRGDAASLHTHRLCVHKCNPGCTHSRGCSPRWANLVSPRNPPSSPSSLASIPTSSPVLRSHVRTRQGEMVDSIEYCVNQTSDHVGQARGELKQAEEYQRRARKVKNMRRQTHTTHTSQSNTSTLEHRRSGLRSKPGKSVSYVILKGLRN